MSCAGLRMRVLRVRGGPDGKTGARGCTVSTGSRPLTPYDSEVSKMQVPEEEIERWNVRFHACQTREGAR